MNSTINVTVFSHGSAQFFELLNEQRVPFRIRRPEPGQIMAAGGEWVEVIQAVGGASVIPSLAAVLVQWLKSRAARKVMIQTNEKQIIHAEGYSVEQLEEILEKASSVKVFQTEPDQED